MLTERLEIRVVDTCRMVTADMFSRFVNPKNQGMNFSWDSFAELVTPLSQSFVEMNVLSKFRKYDKDEVTNLVRETCRVYAGRLVNNAGLRAAKVGDNDIELQEYKG